MRATSRIVVVIAAVVAGCGSPHDVPDGSVVGPPADASSDGSVDPGGWRPPIGIPDPRAADQAGFDFLQDAPPDPDPWTSSVPLFYYVDDDVACSDTANGNGYPGHPRCSIPDHYEGIELAAGSVIEIHGTYSKSHTSPHNISSKGTASQPVFIRGVASAKPTILAAWELAGSYTVVENLQWRLDLAPVVDNDPSLSLGGDHDVVRNDDVHGNLVAGGVAIRGTDQVVYKNSIHDGGDIHATFDQDVHCIAVGSGVSQLWVLDNELARCSGDGIQINGTNASTHHIYVGRNLSHEHKQSGFWSKYASDVIFSQNVAHTLRPSDSSNGDCMGDQYGPERVWFIFNVLYDCNNGITRKSPSGPIGNGGGLEYYVIGNLILDIHESGTGTALANWDPDLSAAVFANNTVYGADIGAGTFYNSPVAIGNNIFSNIANLDISVDQASRATADYNLFDGPTRIVWGEGVTLDLAGLVTLGQCAHCVSGGAAFSDPSTANFHLASGSPAIDAGLDLGAVVNRFQTLYGLDIGVDLDRDRRPAGGAWDLGAYEFGASPAP